MPPTCLRAMVESDMARVLEIDDEAFGADAWDAEDFACMRRDKKAVGVVAVPVFRAVSYMIYQVWKDHFQLVRFAVSATHRREQYGTTLVNRVTAKLGGRRDDVRAFVRESNLDAQLFLRSLGFRATSVCRNGYQRCATDGTRDVIEDEYVMTYMKPELRVPDLIAGRISGRRLSDWSA